VSRGVVWLNGRLRPAARAAVPAFDRGLLFGDGIYETVRAYGGRLFRAREHLDRLAHSAARLELRLPLPAGALAAAMAKVVAANRLGDARVRLVVTRGVGPEPDLGAIARSRPTVLAYATPYAGPPEAERLGGVRAILARTARNSRRALDPAIKSLNLLNSFLARREAARAGARDAVMLNPEGKVAEGVASNVFFVRRGVLCTPALRAGILEGITRGIVLDLAGRLGIPVREGLFRPAALLGAEEVFLTASTIELLPLAALGARRYPAARPVTRALQAAYRVTVADELGRPAGA